MVPVKLVKLPKIAARGQDAAVIDPILMGGVQQLEGQLQYSQHSTVPEVHRK